MNKLKKVILTEHDYVMTIDNCVIPPGLINDIFLSDNDRIMVEYNLKKHLYIVQVKHLMKLCCRLRRKGQGNDIKCTYYR